jgi:hypothetical protein
MVELKGDLENLGLSGIVRILLLSCFESVWYISIQIKGKRLSEEIGKDWANSYKDFLDVLALAFSGQLFQLKFCGVY